MCSLGQDFIPEVPAYEAVKCHVWHCCLRSHFFFTELNVALNLPSILYLCVLPEYGEASQNIL